MIKEKKIIEWLSVIEESPSRIITDLVNNDYTISELIRDIKEESII